MPHKRSPRRLVERQRRWKKRKLEYLLRMKMWIEAYRDRHKAETISRGYYPIVHEHGDRKRFGVEHGEVLTDSRKKGSFQ